MPVTNVITSDKLVRLIGVAGGPLPIAIDFADRDSLIPGSIRRSGIDLDQWASTLSDRSVVVVTARGGAEAQSVTGWLRSAGVDAEALEGGISAWTVAGHPLVDTTHMPSRAKDGRTVWVTRSRPKVDRIACPWLIRRFVDPEARVLFVAADDVLAVAERLGAEPFDVEGEQVFWSHRGDRCTFDTMVEAFGLSSFAPLARLATIVRGADTDRLDLAPEAAGLLAVSLGLSRSHTDDHVQLDAGMMIYDALYRWSRDAQGEKHNWSSHQPARGKASA